MLLLLCSLAFVLLIAGAYGLYEKLSEGGAPDKFMVQNQSGAEETTKAESDTEDITESESGHYSDQVSEESAENEETQEQIAAMDFTVYDAEGNAVHLSDYFGTPIVLNFWASWCGPCQREMPDFQEKFEELGDEIQFLMINVTDGARETVEIASAFIQEQEYTFPVFYDTEYNASNTYGVYSLPMTILIDGEGYIAGYASGTIDGETLQMGIDMITE